MSHLLFLQISLITNRPDFKGIETEELRQAGIAA